MSWITRNADGSIRGIHANEFPGATEIGDDDPEIIMVREENGKREKAARELAISQEIVLHALEEDEELPPEWKDYRKELRKIATGKKRGVDLPARPTIPEKLR